MRAGSIGIACVLFFLVACDEKKDIPAKELPPALSAVASVIASTGPPIMSAAPVASAPPKVPDAITAQHILITYKGAKGADKKVTRTKAEAKTRAELVATSATKPGVDFTALVGEYSEDPASKDRQGSVGKFTREKMTKPFSDAAFALPVDGISGVVESDFGFHVIKRNQ